MRRPGSAWKALLHSAAVAFTSPSFALFYELMSAWVLVTARRSIVQMVGVMDPANRTTHDAYHRLVRAGSWSLSALFCALCKLVVARLAGTGRVVLYLDDTSFRRNGSKVERAGSWGDAVRSTRKRVVYARGLNLVVLCVRVTAPWGGMPIAIPVNVALHRKNGPAMPELAREMMAELATWLPETSFVLCGDGAYATLAGDHLERTVVVSRMRRDAALYEAAPPRTGKAGRPRKRGARLPTPAKLARAATGFTEVELNWRGRRATKLTWTKRGAVVPGLSRRPRPPRCREGPLGHRAGRSLLHHRSCHVTGRGGRDLRRALVDRDVLPRGEARRRGPRAPVLEGQGT
jgi:hypothetical protein